jgi:hypothetical protein
MNQSAYTDSNENKDVRYEFLKVTFSTFIIFAKNIKTGAAIRLAKRVFTITTI